ncbi:MAG: sigma 54-interacting transcriptional regulator [Pseudomonadota bacterium]|nr:sigma 54-interacting transcriptional regulator [bacterium]
MPVLIRGESGTGKELVAHASHRLSPKARFALGECQCCSLTRRAC